MTVKTSLLFRNPVQFRCRYCKWTSRHFWWRGKWPCPVQCQTSVFKEWIRCIRALTSGNTYVWTSYGPGTYCCAWRWRREVFFCQWFRTVTVTSYPGCRCSWHVAGRTPHWFPVTWTCGVISTRWDFAARPRTLPSNRLAKMAFISLCPKCLKRCNARWQRYRCDLEKATAVVEAVDAKVIHKVLCMLWANLPNRILDTDDSIECSRYIHAGVRGGIEAADIGGWAEVVLKE